MHNIRFCCARKASTTCSCQHTTVFILSKCICPVVTVSSAAPSQLARTDSHVILNGTNGKLAYQTLWSVLWRHRGHFPWDTTLLRFQPFFKRLGFFFTDSLHMQLCRYATLATPALVKLISLVTSLCCALVFHLSVHRMEGWAVWPNTVKIDAFECV